MIVESPITKNGTSIYTIVLHRSRVRLGGNNLNLNDTTTQQKAADQIIRPDKNWKSIGELCVSIEV
jgi:hypothetical protein